MPTELDAGMYNPNSPVAKKMKQRGGRLDAISNTSKKRQWGGVLDLIYRSRRNRENAIRELEEQS